MKPGIHPDYHPVVSQDSSAGNAFLTRSIIDWNEGNAYPLVIVDVSSWSHPFWTGARRILDTTGQVKRFHRRYGRRTGPS